MGTKTYRQPHVFRWEWGKWGPKSTVSLMFSGGSGEGGDKNRAVPNVPEKVHNLVTITKQILESWTV